MSKDETIGEYLEELLKHITCKVTREVFKDETFALTVIEKYFLEEVPYKEAAKKIEALSKDLRKIKATRDGFVKDGCLIDL